MVDMIKIGAPVASSETVFSCNVLITIFEHENRCLVYFQGEMAPFRGEGMIYICLIARGCLS